jgi:hypothetical protein
LNPARQPNAGIGTATPGEPGGTNLDPFPTFPFFLFHARNDGGLPAFSAIAGRFGTVSGKRSPLARVCLEHQRRGMNARRALLFFRGCTTGRLVAPPGLGFTALRQVIRVK